MAAGIKDMGQGDRRAQGENYAGPKWIRQGQWHVKSGAFFLTSTPLAGEEVEAEGFG